MSDLWPDRSSGELCRLVVLYQAAQPVASVPATANSSPTASSSPTANSSDTATSVSSPSSSPAATLDSPLQVSPSQEFEDDGLFPMGVVSPALEEALQQAETATARNLATDLDLEAATIDRKRPAEVSLVPSLSSKKPCGGPNFEINVYGSSQDSEPDPHVEILTAMLQKDQALAISQYAKPVAQWKQDPMASIPISATTGGTASIQGQASGGQVQHTEEHLAAYGYDRTGLPNVSVSSCFNGIVKDMFSSVLASVGVPEVHDLSNWISIGSKNNGSLGNMLFSAVPLKKEMPSIGENRCGSPELVTIDGKLSYNDKFWYEQMVFYESKKRTHVVEAGGTGNFMELAAHIPEWTLKDDQLADHREAVVQMNDNGPGLVNEWFKLTLYGPYAWVFKSFMDSPFVKKGHLFGFKPLFLLKNALNQSSGYAARRKQFASCDKGGKSCLMLLGLWRMRGNDRSTLQVIGFSQNGFPFTMTNHPRLNPT